MDNTPGLKASTFMYPMKVVLLGQTCVGKSSIVLRFVQERFIAHTEGTIGAAFLTKGVVLNSSEGVKFEIWDTAGQERYHSLAPMYYRGAQAALVVFDMTSRESFDKAKIWVSEIHQQSNPDQLVAFVANKLDLKDSRSVDREEAEHYAAEQNLIYSETSAKDGTNINELFQTLATRLPKTPNLRFANSNVDLNQNPDRPRCFNC